MSVEVKSNKDEVVAKLEKAIARGLKAIGVEAERFAKKDPMMPVDTGRARNSITWATQEREGQSFSYTDDDGKKFDDQIGGGAEKNAVYLGSNVDYFPEIELGSKNISARHVLQRAVTEHAERYKELMKQSIENA